MSEGIHQEPTGPRLRVLWLSTAAFTLLFAVWLMFGMLAVKFKKEFDLNDGHLYTLTLTAILAGSLLRFNFGVWADKYGGRKVMTLLLLVPVIPTALVAFATEFWHLLVLAGLFGLAGNSFSVGIAWCAAWFPKEKQGLALGVFGAGNVGASATKLAGPVLIAAIPAAGFLNGVIPGGWRFIPLVYAVLLVLMAVAVWFLAPSPDRTPAKAKSFGEVLKPVGKLRVWEYSLHYVVVFGAYVALSNLLPNYYMTVYGSELATHFGLDLKVDAEKNSVIAWVGILAAVCFVFPASLLRPLGGYLSDKFGPRGVMAAVFAGMVAAGVVLTFFPAVGVWGFTAALFVLGVGMGVGKASVYKMIPDAFPNDVGAVGGLVGLLGALGGVLVPLLAKPLQEATGSPQMLFGVLLALTAVSGAWFVVAGLLEKAAQRSVPASEAVKV